MITLFCCKPYAQSGTQAQDQKACGSIPNTNQLISKCQPLWSCCSYHWATAWSVGEHGSCFMQPGATAQSVWIGCKGHKGCEGLWSSKAWPVSWSMLTVSVSHLNACPGICSMPEFCFCLKQLGGSTPRSAPCRDRAQAFHLQLPSSWEGTFMTWRGEPEMEEGWKDYAPKRKKTETALPHLTQIYLPSNPKRELCEGVFKDMTAGTVMRLTVSYSKMKENKRTFNLETKYSFPTVPSVED